MALDALLDAEQQGAVTTSYTFLTHHRQVSAALAKARVSRSEAVLDARGGGLHVRQHTHIDSATLIRELRRSDDALLMDMLDQYHYEDGDAVSVDDSSDDDIDFSSPLERLLRHKGTRVLPVFVLSLQQAPEQLLFDNHQLVAWSQHGVVVLQLAGKAETDPEPEVEQSADDSSNGTAAVQSRRVAPARLGIVDSGHHVNGVALKMDGAGHPTRHIVAGLAAALGGVVPSYQRYDQTGDAFTQDWRWGVGAVNWGPYSNYSGASELTVLAARRNQLIITAESIVGRITARMEDVDSFIFDNLSSPFAYLSQEQLKASAMPVMHPWLNELARRSFAYNESLPPTVVQRLRSSVSDLETRLEQLAMTLFDQDWSSAEHMLQSLSVAVDSFSLLVAHDLEVAGEVVACCRLKHRGAIQGPPAVLSAGVVLLWACAAVVWLAYRSTQPPKAAGRKGTTLPSWAALPR
ncbi:MAG: hypothetical protein WDW38_005125 [Sanguina aurantia]